MHLYTDQAQRQTLGNAEQFLKRFLSTLFFEDEHILFRNIFKEVTFFKVIIALSLIFFHKLTLLGFYVGYYYPSETNIQNPHNKHQHYASCAVSRWFTLELVRSNICHVHHFLSTRSANITKCADIEWHLL